MFFDSRSKKQHSNTIRIVFYYGMRRTRSNRIKSEENSLSEDVPLKTEGLNGDDGLSGTAAAADQVKEEQEEEVPVAKKIHGAGWSQKENKTKPTVEMDRKEMEDLARLITTVLPDCQVETVIDTLESIGVSSIDDLGFVEPDDLKAVLKKVQSRKLLAYARALLSPSERHNSGQEWFLISPASSQDTLRFHPCVRGLSGNSGGDFQDGTLPSSSESSQSIPWGTTSTNAALLNPSEIHNSGQESFPSSPANSSSQATPRLHPCVRDFYVDNSVPSKNNSDVIPSELDNDWHFNFSIPWNIMPSHIKDTLKNQERPSARDRRKVIRLVVAEILAVCKSPMKKHLSEIARKMVLAYPKSFKDVIEGQVVGTGYDSLTKQLQCRVDNYRRTQPMIMTQNRSGEKSRRRKNIYGCVSPDALVVNVEVQQKNKEELQRMFEKNDKDRNKIEMLMMGTFASQRRDVFDEKDTQTMKEEWPYLFESIGLKTHFKQLTGVHIDEEFKETMSKKFRRVLHYFKCLNREVGNCAAKLLQDIHSANTSDDACGAVLMLLLHFKEDERKIFVQVEDTCVSSEVRPEDLPPTPCIVVCGDSPLTAVEFMVAVDQVVVMERISTFTSAMVSMFMMYYIMNIDYPAEVCTTLEFLQRCIFKINPDSGSKVAKQEKRKRVAVNPRVLSLISRISEYDWME
ncbi:uncharacterized protein LOC143475749 isoform X2 [Brachyhypopomus gauderio]|uniref:uncharacterized protein LOC143475749 isoform X2 n=1 Tax=Brachyhypopomus gauderio TaxID=698409 RepID=UPI004041B6D0